MTRLLRFFPFFFALPIWGQVTGPQTFSASRHIIPEPDLTLRCDQPIPPPQEPERYHYDNVYEYLTLRETTIDSICPSHYSVLREWGVAGPGGSLDVQARQRIDIEPVPEFAMITGPQVIEEAEPWAVDWLANPTVEVHACGDFVLEADFTWMIPSNSPWAGQCGVELVWTVTDGCNRTAEFTQIVVLTDCATTLPAYIVESECTDPAACNYGGNTLTEPENCIYPADPSENCFANSVICKGLAPFDGPAIPSDTTPPEIWGVPEVSTDALGYGLGEDWAMGATDNTGLPVTVAMQRSTLWSDACGRREEEVTVRATDVCGNVATAAFIHEVVGEPMVEVDLDFSAIEPTVVDLSQFSPTPWPITLIDSPDVIRQRINLPSASGTWTVGFLLQQDKCTHRQVVGGEVVTIVDDVPPPLYMPADMTLACPPSDVSDPVLGTPSAEEGNWSPFGGVVTMIGYTYLVDLSLDTLTWNGPSDFVLERTGTAQDPLGNIATATQLITVRDTIAPVVPNEIWTFENESDLDVILYAFEAEDNCDGTLMCEVTGWENIEGSCDIVHFLSATDSAGNTGTGSVRFTFENCCDMPTDMNDDGIVGSTDLLLLLAAFGSLCQ